MCEFNCLKKFHEFEKTTNRIPRPFEICAVPPIGAHEAFIELKSKWDIYVGIMGTAAAQHDADPDDEKRKWMSISPFARAE